MYYMNVSTNHPINIIKVNSSNNTEFTKIVKGLTRKQFLTLGRVS